MRTLAVAVLLATVSAGQTAAPSIAGTWTAQFEGRTFVRLELKTTNGVYRGHAQPGRRRSRRARCGPARERGAARSHPHLRCPAARLHRGVSRKEGDDTGRFELRLVDTSHAELLLLIKRGGSPGTGGQWHRDAEAVRPHRSNRDVGAAV